MRHLTEYLIFLALNGICRLLPWFLLRRLAGMLAFLVDSLLGYRSKVARNNVARAFPELDDVQREELVRESYRHWLLVALETMASAGWSAGKLRRVVEVPQTELVTALNSNDNCAIIVTGHFGNWELGLARTAQDFWHQPQALQQRQRNPWIDRALLRFRQRRGAGLIYSRGGIREGLAGLQRGRMLLLLCDQDGGKRGVFAPFFGRMASTPVGSALLHLRSGKPLYFMCCVRVGPQQYRLITEEVRVEHDGEVSEANLILITSEVNRMLEQYVRRYPEQYLWLHKRWKTPYPEESAQTVGSE